MREDIRQYARIGLVHHLLYPRCMEDPDDHLRTLQAFAERSDIETFDCCLPYGDERRRMLTAAIRQCGKEDIAYAAHLFPSRKIPFTTPVPHEQAQVRMIMKDMVEQAAAIGATGFIFASGGPPPAEAADAHYAAFAGFCRWLCAELRPHGIRAMLEPFDTDTDKKFLYGPTAKCVEFIRRLEPETDNFGIELDMAHVVLMHETFADAIKTTAPYLLRVHLGNCVFKDASHPLWGDKHPPIGFEGGEIDVLELTEILRLLLEVGFLQRGRRGSLLIENTPWPGKTEDDTVADAMMRLQKAWARV